MKGKLYTISTSLNRAIEHYVQIRTLPQSALPWKGCYRAQFLRMLRVIMDLQIFSRQIALYYVVGILVAAVVFRVIRSMRRTRDKDQEPLF